MTKIHDWTMQTKNSNIENPREPKNLALATKLKMMCPALILARRRTDKDKGRIRRDTVSMMTNRGLKTSGDPPGDTDLKVILKFFTKSKNNKVPQRDKAIIKGNHRVLVRAPTNGTNL